MVSTIQHLINNWTFNQQLNIQSIIQHLIKKFRFNQQKMTFLKLKYNQKV